MPTSTNAKTQTPRPIFEKTRMETFSNGVFAVALTLLIIDISTIGLPILDPAKRPPLPHEPDFWPKALSFVYSFVVVAVYWVVHHNEMDAIKGTTREFNWLNLIFLLFIVAIPFSAALLGNNWSIPEAIEPDRQCYSYWYKRIPVLTYSANLILAGISLQAAWWYAKRQRNRRWQETIFKDGVTTTTIQTTSVRNWIIPVATVPVLLVALFWSVDWGQGLLVAVPLSYALWTLLVAHRTHIRHEREYLGLPPLEEGRLARFFRSLMTYFRRHRRAYAIIGLVTLAFQLWMRWPVWPGACGLSIIKSVAWGVIWPVSWIVFGAGFL